jgi:hypothetical protein
LSRRRHLIVEEKRFVLFGGAEWSAYFWKSGVVIGPLSNSQKKQSSDSSWRSVGWAGRPTGKEPKLVEGT